MVNDVYKLANYAHVATAIQEYKSAADDLDMEVVSCLAGDFLSPSLLTSLDGGRSMLDVVNQVGFDMVSIGNHEFDIGLVLLHLIVVLFSFSLILLLALFLHHL